MLGMRLSSSNDTNRNDDVTEEEQLQNLVKDMLTRYQNIQKKIKNYNSLLEMSQEFYEISCKVSNSTSTICLVLTLS